MKINLIPQTNGDMLLYIPPHIIEHLGWKTGDTLSLDIPLTGGGLRITRASDSLPKTLGGVKERSNG